MNHSKLSKLPVAVCLAAILILGGCHKKVTAPAPPTPPPPSASAPTATLQVTPSAVPDGQSATLSWTTTNATQASITYFGIVALNGSQTISPITSTNYTITAKGPGGTVEATARLTINPAPPRAPRRTASLTEQQLFQQNMQDIFFDYDKSTLRPADATVAEKDAQFLLKHPDMKIVIGGYCDERGSAEFNIALGESRAQSLKKTLVSDGIAASSIRVISYGKEKPFCTQEDNACWQENRQARPTLDE